jgi:hypothetical protein
MQVRVIPAKYIMKCDDDTFVRIDSVLDQVKKVRSDKSVYVGSMNYFHRPLRSGKWAVTYEVNCSFPYFKATTMNITLDKCNLKGYCVVKHAIPYLPCSCVFICLLANH